MSDQPQDGTLERSGNVSSSRVPLTPLVARRLILDCFEKLDQWTRLDLAHTIEERHRREGGYPGAQPVVAVVKKVLGELRAEGLVQPVSKGLWRYVAESEQIDADTETAGPDGEVAADDQDDGSSLEIQEQIGTGSEAVYVYFNPNDRRLAELEQRDMWECKVGYTAVAVDLRVLGQGARTALSHVPVVGLVIRTDDARTLENVLHRSLRLADRAVVDTPGTEWFMTSPARIKAWYFLYRASLEHLAGNGGMAPPSADSGL